MAPMRSNYGPTRPNGFAQTPEQAAGRQASAQAKRDRKALKRLREQTNRGTG